MPVSNQKSHSRQQRSGRGLEVQLPTTAFVVTHQALRRDRFYGDYLIGSWMPLGMQYFSQMTHSKLRLLLALFACLSAVCRAQVTVDSASARAVLQALRNPSLTLEQAHEACSLPGNQGLVQKENSYGRKATTQSCADALLAAAQGKPENKAFKFNFSRLKPRTAELTELLDRIDTSPVAFQQWVITRVDLFSPHDAQVAIAGYLIVGGVSGGFAFGKPQFFLDLAYFSDFDLARTVMAHELYHAVQGAFAPQQRAWWHAKEAENGPYAALAKQCSTTADYLEALYDEGTASYVGDIFLLRDAKGAAAQKALTEMQDGLAYLSNDVTLLELSITGLNAQIPVSFDAVYSLGFYVPEPEYKLGYVMAKAIATDRGDGAITALLKQPPYSFVDTYLTLPKYGKDDDHPELGPNTIAAIKRLKTGCPRSVGNQ